MKKKRWAPVAYTCTQEAEIRSITVQIVHKLLSQKETHQRQRAGEWLEV
jgi:hypothetical protein